MNRRRMFAITGQMLMGAAGLYLFRGMPAQQDAINLARDENERRVIVMRVETSDSHIIKVVKDDIKRNGSLRDVITQTAGG